MSTGEPGVHYCQQKPLLRRQNCRYVQNLKTPHICHNSHNIFAEKKQHVRNISRNPVKEAKLQVCTELHTPYLSQNVMWRNISRNPGQGGKIAGMLQDWGLTRIYIYTVYTVVPSSIVRGPSICCFIAIYSFLMGKIPSLRH